MRCRSDIEEESVAAGDVGVQKVVFVVGIHLVVLVVGCCFEFVAVVAAETRSDVCFADSFAVGVVAVDHYFDEGVVDGCFVLVAAV